MEVIDSEAILIQETYHVVRIGLRNVARQMWTQIHCMLGTTDWLSRFSESIVDLTKGERLGEEC